MILRALQFVTTLFGIGSALVATDAAEWYVDGSVAASSDGTSWATAFQTIQEGIDASNNGDTVTVAEGVYVENISFNNKSIVLQSTDPQDRSVFSATIIDGNEVGPVVTFAGGETEACVLSGFTIRNGWAGDGGGIQGNVFKDSFNRATIRNNVITGNFASNLGGGIYGCRGMIENNTIENNRSLDGQGGGISVCSGVIRNNVIHYNSARWSGGGLSGCHGEIHNNVIAHNESDHGGGLAYCEALIENNTIVDNVATHGGGLSECWGPVRNCILWGNAGGQVAYWPSLAYCCIQGWRGRETGNISSHPYFVSAGAGDYHLTSWSPCVDAGDPLSPFSEEPQPNGGRVNMRAYGNTRQAARTSADMDGHGLPDEWELRTLGSLSLGPDDDPDGDGMSNVEEYHLGLDAAHPPVSWYVRGSMGQSGDGRSWATAFKTIQEGIDAASDYDTINVYTGMYVENISFKDKNIVLRSQDPSHPGIVANTIVNGGNSGHVVTFSGFESEVCVLEGFTIVNGGEQASAIFGGTWSYATRATIRKNVVRNNNGFGIEFCDGRIEQNSISENGSFGLVFCGGTIHNNLIAGNADTGVMECWGMIQDNLIANNEGWGFQYCLATIQNNTVTGNTVGGMIGCWGRRILNCIIWGNANVQLQDSATPSYSCIEGWVVGDDGNIGANPRFRDPDGPDDNAATYLDNDFRLTGESPCIDAGTNFRLFTWPRRDLDGNCRLSHCAIDMGCYEYDSPPDSDGDLLGDPQESAHGTNPNDEDTDGDGLRDGLEVLRGSDPAVPTPPGIIQVPSEIPTIQAALYMAVNGEEIVVAPGTYPEAVRFVGTDVILRSTDPHDPKVVEATVLTALSAYQWDSVVTFTGNESEACVLSGFMITEGGGDEGGGICGGTWDNHTHATIEYNVITRNKANDAGGGLAYCDGLIQYNTITDHYVEEGDGGGLYDCDGLIQYNVISRNAACEDDSPPGGMSTWSESGGVEKKGPPMRPLKADGAGGGLCQCDGTIQFNIITNNDADDEGGGLAECHGTIQNNLICGNWGEGLDECHGVIQNNLIAGNHREGLVSCNGVIQNNTIVENGPYFSSGLLDCKGTIRNCIIWGNFAGDGQQLHQCSEPTFSCIESWAGGGTNTDSDPSFVATGHWDDNGTPGYWWDDFWVQGDYNLRPDSPCIDAGDNSAFDPPGLDVEENLRIAFGRSSLTVDIGAYEFDSAPFTITQMSIPEGVVRLVWNSQPNNIYAVLSCDNLGTGTWTEEASVPSEGAFTWWLNPSEEGDQKFYKIEMK